MSPPQSQRSRQRTHSVCNVPPVSTQAHSIWSPFQSDHVDPCSSRWFGIAYCCGTGHCKDQHGSLQVLQPTRSADVSLVSIRRPADVCTRWLGHGAVVSARLCMCLRLCCISYRCFTSGICLICHRALPKGLTMPVDGDVNIFMMSYT